MKMLTVALAVTVLIGLIFTGYGVISFTSYSSDYSNNLNAIHSGILAGWSSMNVTDPTLRVYLNVTGGPTAAQMAVFVTGFIFTNQSQSSYVFSFVSPYVIQGFLQSPLVYEGSDTPGGWNFTNIDGQLSGLYYTVKLGDCSFIPCYDHIWSETLVSISQMAYENDYGQYTLVVPFHGGLSFEESQVLPKQTNFINDMENKINFDLFMGQNEKIVSSFPSFGGTVVQWIAWPGQTEYTYGIINSTLTLSYEVPTEANGNSLNESLGLFALGVGIPLALTSFVELVRGVRIESAKKVQSVS